LALSHLNDVYIEFADPARSLSMGALGTRFKKDRLNLSVRRFRQKSQKVAGFPNRFGFLMTALELSDSGPITGPE
jgi:hypothetical protein